MQNNNAVHPNLLKTAIFSLKCLKAAKPRVIYAFWGDGNNHP
jgi:hypothetical protein